MAAGQVRADAVQPFPHPTADLDELEPLARDWTRVPLALAPTALSHVRGQLVVRCREMVLHCGQQRLTRGSLGVNHRRECAYLVYPCDQRGCSVGGIRHCSSRDKRGHPRRRPYSFCGGYRYRYPWAGYGGPPLCGDKRCPASRRDLSRRQNVALEPQRRDLPWSPRFPVSATCLILCDGPAGAHLGNHRGALGDRHAFDNRELLRRASRPGINPGRTALRPE